MKKSFLVLMFILCLFLAAPSEASPGGGRVPPGAFHDHPGVKEFYGYPLAYGWWGGYPYYYGYWGWPNYAYYPYGYGYSFYSYYDYEPYYATYAAISYSPTKDTVGYSTGRPSLSSADEEANSFCGAADCKTVIWVQGGCAVLTTNTKEHRMGYAYAYDVYTAEERAMFACRSGSKTSPGSCVQQAWVCSY
jgi:Domain of unknown function (DUF4189)